MVIEGGFHPDEIVPHPPFEVVTQGKGPNIQNLLVHAANRGDSREATVIGGLKTKDVDVVVNKTGIGPCVAISLKGTLKAFRNLTNRMEEAVGDCANLHMTYPSLVYGFLHVIRATKEGVIPPNSRHLLDPKQERTVVDATDVAIKASGAIADGIGRYHEVLTRLSGRRDIRDDITRYEAVSLVLASVGKGATGIVDSAYPSHESPLRFERFFERIFEQYDLRFVYGAPALDRITRRLVWDPDSPAFKEQQAKEYDPRLGRS
jgi:hypothetical protein